METTETQTSTTIKEKLDEFKSNIDTEVQNLVNLKPQPAAASGVTPQHADEEDDEYKDFERKLKDIKKSALAKIRLNVGGTVFHTSVPTLMKEKSLLAALASGRFNIDSDETGEYFIDRDAKHFGTILTYLRTGHLRCKDTVSPLDKLELLDEVEYYQIESLLDVLKPERRKHKIIHKRKRVKKAAIKYRFAKTEDTIKIRVLYPQKKEVHRQLFEVDRSMTLQQLKETLTPFTINQKPPKIVIAGDVWEDPTDKVLGDVVKGANFVCMRTAGKSAKTKKIKSTN